MISRRRGWYTCGAFGVLSCPVCHGGGACLRRWVVHLWGRMISGGVGGTPAAPAVCFPALLFMVTACRRRWQGVLALGWCTCGRMISGGVVHLRGLAVCLPALLAMVRAFRRRGRVYLRRGGVYLRGPYDLAGGWCTCGAYDLRRRGWCACGAYDLAGCGGAPAAPAACLPAPPWRSW
ncbi:MAG: hypothetical protein MSQ05_01270 [Akkermansia sp.]|nr:hypothetical protein [Akkermansia sp.]